MTAPPATARCPACRRDQPLCPDGRTLTRHYDNRQPASAKHCRGGRQAAGAAKSASH